MTSQEAIAELEKAGALTWEMGDIAIAPEGGSAKDNKYVVVSKDTKIFNDGPCIKLYNYFAYDNWLYVKDCTHSADDPRLLGRVMKALGDFSYLSISYLRGYQYTISTQKEPIVEMGDDELRSFHADTLLHALLLAWLAKVEGEQSWRGSNASCTY